MHDLCLPDLSSVCVLWRKSDNMQTFLGLLAQGNILYAPASKGQGQRGVFHSLTSILLVTHSRQLVSGETFTTQINIILSR